MRPNTVLNELVWLLVLLVSIPLAASFVLYIVLTLSVAVLAKALLVVGVMGVAVVSWVWLMEKVIAD